MVLFKKSKKNLHQKQVVVDQEHLQEWEQVVQHLVEKILMAERKKQSTKKQIQKNYYVLWNIYHTLLALFLGLIVIIELIELVRYW